MTYGYKTNIFMFKVNESTFLPLSRSLDTRKNLIISNDSCIASYLEIN